MSTVTKSLEFSLQEARRNIDTQNQRKILLKGTDPNTMTDEKVKDFVRSVVSWYAVWTRYGEENKETLMLADLQTYSKFGEAKANKNMPKFKEWLTKDIREQIANLNDRISADQGYIARRVK